MRMGSNELIVIGLFLVPVVLLMLLRVNAAFAFLSVCLGYVLMQFTSVDVRTFADAFMPQATLGGNVMQLVLLLGPVLLTMLFMVHTVRGTKFVLNILPAAGVGFLVVLFVTPLLSPGISHAMMMLPIWRQFSRMQSLAVGAGALISLFLLWSHRPHHEKEKKSDKHH